MSNSRGPALSQTWWGSRWIQSLRRFGRDWSRSLTNARGAAEGIHDLKITPGNIEAVVPGEGDVSYQLQIRVRTLDQGTWRRILRRLASKALYAARLLSGEMPRDIERVFAQSRASLFPRRRREVEFVCSCEQPYTPCSHVAAAQFVLAEAFDRDPFLLFELRGRGREDVLSELREIRGASASNDRAGADVLADEEAWVQPRPEDYTVAGEDLATIGFHIAAADVTVGTIRALGAPRSWPQPLALLKAMVPLYRAASGDALEIAWGGEEEVPASARLPEPESEQSLIAMAESMVESTVPASDAGPSSRRSRRGGRKRRGRRGKGQGGRKSQVKSSATSGAKSRRGGGGEGGGASAGGAAPSGKKRRRRRRRGGGGGTGAGAGQGGGERGGRPNAGGGGSGGGGQGQAASGQSGKKRRRRRRRRGGGGGGGAGGGGGNS